LLIGFIESQTKLLWNLNRGKIGHRERSPPWASLTIESVAAVLPFTATLPTLVSDGPPPDPKHFDNILTTF
jgi:hypothetical protein